MGASDAAWQRHRSGGGQELMYFPSGELLRVVTLGNELMAADLVWLRGVQYYGEHRLGDKRFPWIGHIFDVATRLDPRFVNAYLFGALVLADGGEDVHQAIALMKRGLAANPDSHLLAFEIGFHYHVFLRDFERAASYYRRALQMDGCPAFVKRFAAFTLDRSNRPGEALLLWQEIAAECDNPILQRLATERMAEAISELELQEVVD